MRNLKREVREAEGNRPPFPGFRFQDKRRHVSAPTLQFLPKVSLLWALPPGALPPCLPLRLEPQNLPEGLFPREAGLLLLPQSLPQFDCQFQLQNTVLEVNASFPELFLPRF